MATIAPAIVLGMAAMLAGTLPRNILFAANRRLATSLPWAVPAIAAYLWCYWRYLDVRRDPADINPSCMRRLWIAIGLAPCVLAMLIGETTVAAPQRASCFLLYELGVGELRRAPAEACRTRVAPASTFKVPHALAALDAGVVNGADERIAYDGRELTIPAWRHDHTLRTAMRDSVVWYFQTLATRLGEMREREYLERFNYGNQDPSSGLTTFWLGESLLVSPEEQVRFLRDLYADALPVDTRHMATVREILVQPRASVVNANGAHPFGKTWGADTVLSAKTGSVSDRSGANIRWLVGHVSRGRRAWIFASLVTGPPDVPALAAVDQAAAALTAHHVLMP